MFAHENLKVYHCAVAFAGRAASLSCEWDKKHAIVDHLDRATESIVLNLAEAARLPAGSPRVRIIDYAVGSALECAGCLDIASAKTLIAPAASSMSLRNPRPPLA